MKISAVRLDINNEERARNELSIEQLNYTNKLIKLPLFENKENIYCPINDLAL